MRQRRIGSDAMHITGEFVGRFLKERRLAGWPASRAKLGMRGAAPGS
jgi:hypothetical protein